MSEAPSNLTDFFSAHKKKDKKQKGKAGTKTAAAETKPAQGEDAKASSAASAQKEENKVEVGKQEPATKADAHDSQAAKKSTKKTNAFEDSEEEEEASIVLKDELRSKLKEKKDVDASRRNEEERKQEAEGLGWGFGSKVTKQAPQPEAQKKTGPKEIDFTRARGPPTFTRANNKVVNKQEFPELGDFAGKQEVLKKDGNYGAVGSTATAQATQKPRENKEFTMPVFTGKAKLNFGTGEDPPGTKQYNYDLGSLRKSTATTKPTAGKEGEKPSQRPRAAAAGGGGDDDFEMVTDKKKQKREFPRGDGAKRGF